MIPYQRTTWYGVGYFFVGWSHWRGSLVFRCTPAALFSGAIAALCLMPPTPSADVLHLFREAEVPVYGVQIFSLVFGYLCVARLNISYRAASA